MTTKIRIINFGPKPIRVTTAAQVSFVPAPLLNSAAAAPSGTATYTVPVTQGPSPSDIVYPGGVSGDMWVFDTQSVHVSEVA
jgi:hypothetical protein